MSMISACLCKSKEILEILIKNGSNINQKDYNGQTPLHLGSFLYLLLLQLTLFLYLPIQSMQRWKN